MENIVLRDIPDSSDQVAADKETRLTLRLSQEARDTLEWIASQRHVSLAEAIRRALGTERFFIEMSKKQARILVEQPGERIKEVILV